jgi:hypothetical protein
MDAALAPAADILAPFVCPIWHTMGNYFPTHMPTTVPQPAPSPYHSAAERFFRASDAKPAFSHQQTEIAQPVTNASA